MLSHPAIVSFIRASFSSKPAWLVVPKVVWKYGIRNVIRGKNMMIVGTQGSGKTVCARELAKACERPFFVFNLGAMQDARVSIVGNTHFDSQTGTVFTESEFIRAITTENAVVLLDELSRAPKDVWNLLMTILDYEQRYVRLDESRDYATVTVANGVCFIATANIGTEFTATHALDRALLDRFTILEMPVLDATQEMVVLRSVYPDLSDAHITAVAEIASKTRFEVAKLDAKIETAISTRMSIEFAGLLHDGFTLSESAEVAVYPFYEDDGGDDSERTYVKQLVQKYIHGDSNVDTLFGNDALFKAQEVF